MLAGRGKHHQAVAALMLQNVLSAPPAHQVNLHKQKQQHCTQPSVTLTANMEQRQNMGMLAEVFLHTSGASLRKLQHSRKRPCPSRCSCVLDELATPTQSHIWDETKP